MKEKAMKLHEFLQNHPSDADTDRIDDEFNLLQESLNDISRDFKCKGKFTLIVTFDAQDGICTASVDCKVDHPKRPAKSVMYHLTSAGLSTAANQKEMDFSDDEKPARSKLTIAK